MRISSYIVLTGGGDGYALDGYVASGSLTSDGVFLGHIKGYSITLSCPATGSPSGTVKLQGCNDQARTQTVADSINLVNWFDITGLSSPLSGASTIVLNDTDSMYRWVRLVWTAVSGSITMTCHMQVKGIA